MDTGFKYRLIKGSIVWTVLLFVLAACSGDPEQPDPVEIVYDFEQGDEGWTAGISDYRTGADHQFEFEHTALPVPLDQNLGSLMLSGLNRSDDLFMFVKKPVSGLKPNTTYTITFTVVFATSMPREEDTAPLESVWVKAGAAPFEPLAVPDEQDYYRMNVDIGEQSVSGEHMMVLGNFNNGTGSAQYVLKSLENQSQFLAQTNDAGGLWLIVGVDSGKQGPVRMYINTIRVLFE